MADKSSAELSAIFKRPDDWLPEALDAARAELARRGVDPNAIVGNQTPVPEAHPRILKIDRYVLVVAGCLIHAIVLHILGNLIQTAYSDHTREYHVPPFGVWFGFLLIWPAWGIALWFSGQKKKLKTIIPLLAGIAIMWPMLEYIGYELSFVLGIMAGGRT